MSKKWKVITVVALALGVGAAISAGGPPVPAIDSAADIVPSLVSSQMPIDRLPEAAAKAFGPTGIDRSSSRWLGGNQEVEYYGVPLGNEICIVTVGSDGSGRAMGCTPVKGFEAYGLRVKSPDGAEEAWLLGSEDTASTIQKDLAKTQDSHWVKAAPHFLMKSAASPR